MQKNDKKPSRNLYDKWKYLLAVSIILICFIAGYAYMVATWNPVNDETSKISEQTLRLGAARHLGKELYELTNDDFLKINELIIIDVELSDITFLEKFTNLQRLYLLDIKFPKNEIPVWMKVLSKIGFSDPYERFGLDLSPLENLNNLEVISLRGPLNKDIEPLTKIPNLIELALGDTQVSDFEPLKQMTNLNALHLYNLNISDLEPLRNLPHLGYLDINNLPVINLEPLKELNNLKKLEIRDCPKVTDQQIEDLQKALPKLIIYRLYSPDSA